MGRGGTRTSPLNIGRGPQTMGLIDPLGIWGPSATYFDFDLAQIAFTAGMAKREGNGPFAAAPIVQGAWDGTGTPDVISYPRGNQIGNPTGVAYANLDPYQGSIVLWLTPEWNGNDGKLHYIFSNIAPNGLALYKSAANLFTLGVGGQTVTTNAAVCTAGTTYFLVARWDTKKTLDGTNYLSLSVNDVAVFGGETAPTAVAPAGTLYFGQMGTAYAVDAIVEGLTIYRRILTDGTYGDSVNGDLDEIAAIYAAGAGADPTTITGGSWDIAFCMPTDSAVGALVTGTGEAWSHPLESGSIEEHPLCDDGGYLGGAYAVFYDGTDTDIDCGSGVTLDDLPNGANGFQVGIWARPDDWGEANSGHLLSKYVGDGSGGWNFGISDTAGLFARVYCPGGDAYSASGTDDFTPDGKWHFFLLSFEHIAQGGDGRIYFAVDGRWVAAYTTQTAESAAYGSDAAVNLHIGNSSPAPSHTQEGVVGWAALWNNVAQYPVGTDFIHPRTPPGAGGNLVESWKMDDGTGAVIAATVTSPGNDGTLANGTWEAQWAPDGTPVPPTSYEFDGTVAYADCGSGIPLDDICAAGGQITVGAWVRMENAVPTAAIMSKGFLGSGGYTLSYVAGNVVLFLDLATTPCAPFYAQNIADKKWHYIGFHYDDATKSARVFVDGLWGAANVGVGAYQSDAANNLTVGRQSGGATWFWPGAISEVSIWSDDHFGAGNPFLPPARNVPPAAGGTLVESWAFSDGAGVTLTATVTSPGNDGTITPGTGKWNNTMNLPTDVIGKSIFPWGYVFWSNSVNDGIQTVVTGLTPGDGYVVRALLGFDPDGRSWPAIRIYDNVGAAEIVQFVGPRLSGQHTGGAVATLIDAAARWGQDLVGGHVYNITTVADAPITAVSGDGTTITAAVAGGWNLNDVYRIVPPYDLNYAWAETFCFTLPAGCTSIQVQVRNLTSEGAIYLHQIEVIENLLLNGDHESLTGANPDIITGWANNNLDAGDTQASSGGGNVIHSGVEAMQWNVGAINNEAIMYNVGIAVPGDFICMGAWVYGDGAIGLRIGSVAADRATLQTSLATDKDIPVGVGAYWVYGGCILRSNTGAAQRLALLSVSGATGSRYSDDVFAFLCNAVFLTCTPADQPNSLESGGIRIDGRDTCTQPIPVGAIGATAGHIRWRDRLRHPDPIFLSFQEAAAGVTVARFQGIANFIRVDFSAANAIRLSFDTGLLNAAFTINPGFVADQEYLFEIVYTATQAQLLIDGIAVVTLVTPIDFGIDIPTTAWWGSRITGASQSDAVFINP